MCVAFSHICALILFCGFGTVAAQCPAEPTFLSGILGKTLVLSFGDLQNISKIILKKKIENIFTKLLEYDVPAKKHILPESQDLQYNEERSTVTLVRLRREDEGEYVLIKEFGRSEHLCTVNIKVYEQIANMSIDRIIRRHNDTRVVILNCTTKAGDEVSFSWSRGEEILNHSSNVLQINLTSESELHSYTCRARNPVSETSINTTSYTLSSTPQGSFSLTPPEIPPAPVQQEPQDTMANTIYTMVQKAPLPAPEVSTVYELAGPFNQNRSAS